MAADDGPAVWTPSTIGGIRRGEPGVRPAPTLAHEEGLTLSVAGGFPVGLYAQGSLGSAGAGREAGTAV